MSSELEKLVETITDLVLGELGGAAAASNGTPAQAASEPRALAHSGSRVLVVPGPRSCDPGSWEAFEQGPALQASVFVWDGFCQKRLPASCAGWGRARGSANWSKVVDGYKGVVLLGSDLSVLASLANLGSGDVAPASVAAHAVGSGLPVFVDNRHFEALRRHSSRLASGFVSRFEEFYRIVASFGVEFGGPGQLASFLDRCTGAASTAGSSTAPRSGGRDVVTVEDVEAVRRTGEATLYVAMGTIVTPLAYQRASEWAVEVVFQ